jgi:hypothetical protein
VIYFGSVAAEATDINVVSWSDNTIEVLVPAGAAGGPQSVIVSVAGNDSNGQSFTVLPHIDSLSAESGPTGSSVTLTGTSFGSSQGSGGVTVNGVDAAINSWANTTIGITIPDAALDGEVIVTDNFDSQSVGFGFDVTPTFSSFDPLRLAPGSALTIAGSGFGPDQGDSFVTFNGQGGSPIDGAIYNSWSENQIVVIVPAAAETGTLTINIVDNGVGSDIDSVTSGSEFIVLLPSPVIVDIGQL